jgi:hypothetical protein
VTTQRKKAQPGLAEAIERGEARGRKTLRRKQVKLAIVGNATMRICLGKQLSGQRDVQSLEANGGRTGTQIQLVVMSTIRCPSSRRCWISRVS